MKSIYYNELKDKRLWFDGQESYDKKMLYDKILSGNIFEEHINIHCNIDKELKTFSKLENIKLIEKDKINLDNIDTTFKFPEKYKNINIKNAIYKKFENRIKNQNLTQEEIEQRICRIEEEFKIFEDHFLIDVLRLGLYIIDTFKNENIVWGPGRGSSCCSYILYLIELHDIDSVFYELDINEFLRGH